MRGSWRPSALARGLPAQRTRCSCPVSWSSLRRHWPQTPLLVRGDRHCATPEVSEVIAHRRLTDFVFGLAGNAVLLRQAAP